MINELLLSFKDNVKKKIRNPFLGTLGSIFVIKNWKLFYVLLTLDSNISINERISEISKYLNDILSVRNILMYIMLSIAVIIITYVMMFISNLIVVFYEKRAVPLVYKLLDIGSIVLRIDYIKLQNDFNSLSIKYDNERIEKNRLREERDSIENQLVQILNQDKQIQNTQTEIETDNEKNIEIKYNVENFYELLRNKKLLEIFDSVNRSIRTQEYVNYTDESIMKLIEYGIIQIEKKGYGSYANKAVFKLTDRGNNILKLREQDYLQ
jgi:hypothetical protein